MTSSVAIIDYGHGNLGSILNMLNKIGYSAQLVRDPMSLEGYNKIILPGVGAFDSGMKALEDRGFREILIKKVLIDRAYLLGICLGMQMLGCRSEEGLTNGLGLISGRCTRFPSGEGMRLKVPHMGWAEATPSENAILFRGLNLTPRFYFVHSYYFECDNSLDIAATSNYGVNYTSAVQRDNIFGVQFHPEKSHRFGMELFKNFLRL